jgi:predicted component of type VI protein secretion system
METAATHHTKRAEALGVTASLRLRQGSSTHASCVLEEMPGGTMISVGTDSACDWQIRAAFVPPRAFSLLLAGGHVFLRSGAEPGVLINGKPVCEGWNPVSNGARIDVGLARLEVTLDGQSEPAILVDAPESEELGARVTRPYVAPAPRENSRLRDVAHDVTSELEEFRSDQSGEYEVVPALLDNAPSPDKSRFKRYALLGVITVSAYTGWIALLDQL